MAALLCGRELCLPQHLLEIPGLSDGLQALWLVRVEGGCSGWVWLRVGWPPLPISRNCPAVAPAGWRS